MSDHKRALEMDGDNSVKLLLTHIHQQFIAQDTSIVDDDVKLPERFHRPLDQAMSSFPIGNTVGIRNSLTTSSNDLINHPPGKTSVPTGAIDGNPRIIDHDSGSLR